MRNRNGHETVEFALVLPIVLLLAFAAIEFARVSNVRYALNSASYEAARNVIVPGATSSEARIRAEQILNRHGLKLTDITINPATIDESTAEVTVGIDAVMKHNAWGIMNFTKNATLNSETTLLTERAASIIVDAIPDLPPPPPGPSEPSLPEPQEPEDSIEPDELPPPPPPSSPPPRPSPPPPTPFL